MGTSAGYDHFDLAECRRRGIRVTGAGDSFSEDAADFAVGLLIDVLRRVSVANRFVRAGSWPVKGEFPLGSKVNFVLKCAHHYYILFIFYALLLVAYHFESI